APSTSPRSTRYSPDSASRPEMSAPIFPAPRMRTRCMRFSRHIATRGRARSLPAAFAGCQSATAGVGGRSCGIPRGRSGARGHARAASSAFRHGTRSIFCFPPEAVLCSMQIMRSPATTPWHPAAWQAKPAQQQPSYADRAALERVVAELSRLPPIVVSWEVEALRERLARAQRGQAFLLQGGDCAETFADCESDRLAKQLKILLQMSLVLLHGLKKPVIRVGRMAGQYAKPRSADTETRNGVTLPSYRGDLVNRPEFTPEARTPDPQLLLRGYERAALTLNFVRALVGGGFADLHHPEYWDLGFVHHSPLADTYRRIAASIADALDFFESISGRAVHETTRADFYASHEALHLLYE